MKYIDHIIVLFMLTALSSCAGVRSAPLVVSEPVVTRPAQPIPVVTITPDMDPENAMRMALEAYRAGNGGSALSMARQLGEQHPNTPWYKRSLFLTEMAFIQLDRPAEADAAMLRVQAEYAELADYAVYSLAEYHFAKSRYTQAAAMYQHLEVRYPKSSLSVRSAFRRGQALLEAYAYLPAAEVMERFLQDNPRSEFAPAAGLALGQALTAEANLMGAVQAYRNVWVQYPGEPNDQSVAKALAELKAGGVEIPEPSPTELYERARTLSRLNQHEKTIESFNSLLEREPSSLNRPEALFRIGVASYNLGRRNEAVAVLEKMIKEYPSDPRTPDALNWLGKSYSKLGDWDKGVKTFQKILDRFPENEWADDALFLTGNIYREAGDMKKALHYYGRLVTEYPDSKFADSAIWWKAWSYYSAGEYKKTELTLQELVNRYPRSFLVNQARYWQGRSAEKLGDNARASAYYERVLKKGPYTYYGYRSVERVTALEALSDRIVKTDAPADAIMPCADGTCVEDPLASYETDDGPPVWTDETRQLLEAQPSFRKTLELMHLDMKKEAAAELWCLQEKMPRRRGALIGLSKAFFELGDYYRSIMLVLRNYERYLEGPLEGTPEDLWRLAYPQGYWESILSSARKFGQDPYFVAAIIREESQFHVEALSPVGARGLMQVMPATGQWVSQIIKLPGFTKDKLFDSDTVITIGTYYISHLMKRFKGDPLLVAAAYNAGPEAVAGWINKNGYGKERDVFVESIPFSETRGYVKKVLRNYGEYKRIYGRGEGTSNIGSNSILSMPHTD